MPELNIQNIDSSTHKNHQRLSLRISRLGTPRWMVMCHDLVEAINRVICGTKLCLTDILWLQALL